jgi:hypothetical protein
MLAKGLTRWIYPGVTVAIGVLALAWLLTRFELSIQVEPIPDEAESTAPALPSPAQPIPVPSSTDDALLVSPDRIPAHVDNHSHIRVSNRSIHPVRVAILAQAVLSPTDAAPDLRDGYRDPMHWDFAPAEGSARGLLLSSPDEVLTLQPGDIVVAFAQDGSRHYWGPFVVGSTPTPAWHTEDGEWYLVLSQP